MIVSTYDALGFPTNDPNRSKPNFLVSRDSQSCTWPTTSAGSRASSQSRSVNRHHWTVLAALGEASALAGKHDRRWLNGASQAFATW